MITIYTITYNEEMMIEFFINHYRKRFPNCHIIIYDNYSTDNTVDIAKKHNCEIIMYDSNNKISDRKYLEIKNNCWKNSKTDWVLVCDCDELVDIDEQSLKNEELFNVSIINFEGYDMVNNSNNELILLDEIKYGVKNILYDKKVLFNKEKIKNINYEPGCHKSNPNGEIIFSQKKYKLFHYKYISETYLINRYKLFSNRLSDENKRFNWGYHYTQHENEIRKYFNELKTKCKIVYE